MVVSRVFYLLSYMPKKHKCRPESLALRRSQFLSMRRANLREHKVFRTNPLRLHSLQI